MKKNVFLICPVRNANEEQKLQIQDYIEKLENRGIEVYYPARDTDQHDAIGYRICCDNRDAIEASDEVHIFYDENSSGTLFDLGVAFAFEKPLIIVNDVARTEGKSFQNMMLMWSRNG